MYPDMGQGREKDDDPEFLAEGVCEDCCEVNYNGNDTCACCCPNIIRHICASCCDACLLCLESPMKIIFGTINVILLLASTACAGFSIEDFIKIFSYFYNI